MSTAIKRTRLSSEEKTAEFELPKNTFSRKGTVVPPTPAVQQQVQTLRSVNKEIKTEIEQVKTEAVRKQDESTRVFNLRQAQLVQKIKDLEVKKLETEKTIQRMMDEKGKDLAKTSRNIDELADGMYKLTSIRNELQNFFEAASAERKKNAETLITQGVEIQGLQRLMQACHELMTKEYAQLESAIRPLLQEKMEMEKSCNHLKSEQMKIESELRSLESKKLAMDVSIGEVDRRLQSAKEHENQQSALHHSFLLKIEDTKHEMESYQQKCSEFEHRKNHLHQEISHLQEQHDVISKSGESLKWSIVSLTEQQEQKKTNLSRMEQELADTRKRIEDLRVQESDLQTSCSNYTSNLHHLRGEVAGLESSREAALKMQEEALKFLQERKDFYHQHVQDLEYNHKNKIGLLEKQYQEQKAEWDKNFSTLEETQTAELEAKLEQHTVRYHALLKDRQSVLLNDITKVVKRHLTRTVFETGQQRAELAQDELVPLLKNYFNQTPTLHGKFWHNWKLWFYTTMTSTLIIAGFVAKMVWFK